MAAVVEPEAMSSYVADMLAGALAARAASRADALPVGAGADVVVVVAGVDVDGVAVGDGLGVGVGLADVSEVDGVDTTDELAAVVSDVPATVVGAALVQPATRTLAANAAAEGKK